MFLFGLLLFVGVHIFGVLISFKLYETSWLLVCFFLCYPPSQCTLNVTQPKSWIGIQLFFIFGKTNTLYIMTVERENVDIPTFVILDYELICLIIILCWTEESGAIPIQEKTTTEGAATKVVQPENDLPEPPTVNVAKPKYRLVQPSVFVPFATVIAYMLKVHT